MPFPSRSHHYSPTGPLVGYALLVVLVQFLVPVLSLHQAAPLVSLHLPSYLAGQVVPCVESPFLGSPGLELPVVFVFPQL